MIEIKGLDKLQSNLKKIERNAKAMNGAHNVALEDILTKKLLRKKLVLAHLSKSWGW